MAEVQEQEKGQERDREQGPEGEGHESRYEGARRNPRRKRTVRFIVLALIVVAAIVAIPVYAYYSVRESTDDAQIDGHVVPISPRINGTILSVLVNDNQPVKAGQEILRLDPADYQVALAQAEAAFATAEASALESRVNVPLTDINTRSQVSTSDTQLNQAQAGVASAQQGVDSARARLNSANGVVAQRQANYTRAQRDLARLKDLVEKDEISKQDYDAAVAAAEANGAQVESAKADVVGALHDLDQAIADLNQSRARLETAVVQKRQSEAVRPRQTAVTEARYRQAQAQLKQRQAEIDQARLNLGYTTIKAPVDGVVTRKTAEPGQQVAPGQQIMALVPLDDVWVTANFKETQLRKMRVSQRVEIEVDTYGSSHRYRGHVDSIAAASGARLSLLPPENATGNYVKVVQRVPVKIVLEPGENREHYLIPGMSVTPTVLLNTGPNSGY